jgi:glutaredoxin
MGIPFKEIDVEEVEGAEAEVRALSGGTCKVPTIRIDDFVLVEPTEAELRAALEAGS